MMNHWAFLCGLVCGFGLGMVLTFVASPARLEASHIEQATQNCQQAADFCRGVRP